MRNDILANRPPTVPLLLDEPELVAALYALDVEMGLAPSRAPDLHRRGRIVRAQMVIDKYGGAPLWRPS